MVSYLDAVFITGIMIVDTKSELGFSTAFAYLVLAITSIIPLFVTIFLCAKFSNI